MAAQKIFVVLAFAALVCGADVEESDQKKRGAGKTTTLNAIPTGAQKPEYTYSIYTPNPSQSNQPSPQYQTQVPNSFYPSQGASQYYSSNPPPDASIQYQQQPQINLLPPQASSQFVPLNFIPNPGYQAKYQLVPSKTQNGNIQLALVPQPQTLSPQSVLPYSLFSPHSGQIQGQNPYQGQFNFQNYQSPIGNSFFGHSPTMFLLPQPNPSLYQNPNLLYQNPNAPVQSFYNYYPVNPQAKYSASIPPPSPEYEKIQGPVSQSVSKDDNDLSVHSTEYITPSDASNYKNVYSSSRTYSKHQ